MVHHTEHTVKLPDGIELYYTDSGAPKSSYSTLVILHGSAFNGDGFIPVHEYASQKNLRVIALNRRDYRGSTKYTDAELEDLAAGRKVFQDRLALQLAWFLKYFIDHEGIPTVSREAKSGGFILMGWSFGTATLLSLFSDPTVIPKALYETIERYLLSIILYDPPNSALGYPQPPDEHFYNPFTDPDYRTGEEIYENFEHWVSSYFTHPDIASGKASGISYAKRTEKRTINNWTEEEKEKYVDKLAAARSEFPACVPHIRSVLLRLET
ncbi:Alpha/Beta hydrolase protein [Mycena polygramma]|nr:Alpha/Beta hydrolase protein [Mycena polygramma]